jgi:hypothetical protein
MTDDLFSPNLIKGVPGRSGTQIEAIRVSFCLERQARSPQILARICGLGRELVIYFDQDAGNATQDRHSTLEDQVLDAVDIHFDIVRLRNL